MKSEPVKVEEIGNKIVRIYVDENPNNPREICNLGKMVCFHRRYNLGDNNNLSPDMFEGWEEMKDYLTKELNAVVILPLYLYDHSGLRIKVGSFGGLLPQGHAEFDSRQVGFIYATKEDILAYYDKEMTEELKKEVEDTLSAEVKIYNQYLQGDIYGYTINKRTTCPECGAIHENVLDSCWGFYGIKDVIEVTEEELKELIEL